jgi:hypothetical protein
MAKSMFDHLAESMSSPEDVGACNPMGDYLEQEAKDRAAEDARRPGDPVDFDPEDWERAYRKRRRFNEMTESGGKTFDFSKRNRY